MTEKKFELSKCPKDQNGHLLCQTRDGEHTARIVATDRECGHFPVVALLKEIGSGHAFESYESYGLGGNYSANGPHPLDLVNLTVKKEGWVNIYPSASCSGIVGDVGGIYATKEDANTNASRSRIACIPIEWEE